MALYCAKVDVFDGKEFISHDPDTIFVTIPSTEDPEKQVEDYLRKNEMIAKDAIVHSVNEVQFSTIHPISIRGKKTPDSNLECFAVSSKDEFHECTEEYFELYISFYYPMYNTNYTEYFIHKDGQLEIFFKDYTLYRYTLKKSSDGEITFVYVISDVEEKMQPVIVLDYMRKGYELDTVHKADSMIGESIVVNCIFDDDREVLNGEVTFTEDNLYDILNRIYYLRFKAQLYIIGEDKRYFPLFVYAKEDTEKGKI